MTESDGAPAQLDVQPAAGDEFDPAGEESAEEAKSPFATAPIAQAALGVVAVAFGVVSLFGASSLAMFGKKGIPGPGMFPTVTAVAVTVLGLTLVGISVLRRIRTGPGESLAGTKPEVLRSLSVWIGLMICIALMDVIGFAASSALLIAYLVLVVERVRGIKAVAAIVGVPLAAYVLFGFVLGVDLPTSVFIEGI